MKRLLFVLFLAIGLVGNAQTKPLKDTVIQPKQYNVTFYLNSWMIIDSVLRNGINYVGRSLSVDDADKVKSTMFQVLNLFAEQLNAQIKAHADSVGRKPK